MRSLLFILILLSGSGYYFFSATSRGHLSSGDFATSLNPDNAHQLEIKRPDLALQSKKLAEGMEKVLAADNGNTGQSRRLPASANLYDAKYHAEILYVREEAWLVHREIIAEESRLSDAEDDQDILAVEDALRGIRQQKERLFQLKQRMQEMKR